MNQLTIFQQTIATTNTPQQLPAGAFGRSITITAVPSNTAAIVLGDASSVTTANGYPLEKGASVILQGSGNTDALWAVGTAGDSYGIIGA